MKYRYIYILVIALLVASCSGNKQSFTLSGSFKGLDNGEFLCFSRSAEWGSLDTVKVVGGEFTLSHPLTDTTIIVLQYPNFMQTQVIAIPGTKVSLKGDANNMKRIRLSGNDDNEALSDFNERTADLKLPQLQHEAELFIAQNPQSWASVALFEKYFLQVERPDYAKTARLLDLMLKACPNRAYLHVIDNEVAAVAKCRVGTKLPPFKAVTIGGAVVTNQNFSGKAVLISFWSSMDNEFIYPLVGPRRLMRRLSSQISQLNICLDADTVGCMRVLRTDTIGGYNVCDRLTFDSPLVATFGLKKLPANILVDSKGIIRARDIAPDALEAEFAKIGIK